MKHYRITLISATDRIERSVIAHSSCAAICIGITMMPPTQGPFCITCKPSAITCATA